MALRLNIPALICFAIACLLAASASSQRRPMASQCMAMANFGPRIQKASFKIAALQQNQARITYLGHSTFLIESPLDVTIATDFTGYYGSGALPDVVTMNHAHTSHYTDTPDPGIKHVLRGWNPKGGYAHHDLQIKDVHIRSIPTNIRTWSGSTEMYGNSIFIFEVGGLCIGHVGHLQHELTLQQLGQIGQLDVVMVPVDGFVTLDHDGLIKVLKKLKPRLIIPMHSFTEGSLETFLARMRQTFAVRVHSSPGIVLSQAVLPPKSEILVLPGF